MRASVNFCKKRHFPMQSLSLEQLSNQLESDNSADRMVALAHLRHVSPDRAVPLIKKVLDDDNLQVRSMAVFALGVKPTEECFPILVRLMETDPDYGIRAAAAGALGYLEDPRAFEALVRVFYEDTDWLVRFSVAVSLGNLKNPQARDVLIRALDSDQIVMQQAAIAALGEIEATEAVDRVASFVQSDDWLVRMRLADALGNMPSDKSVSALRYLAKDAHPQVSRAAQLSLDRLSDWIETQNSLRR